MKRILKTFISLLYGMVSTANAAVASNQTMPTTQVPQGTQTKHEETLPSLTINDVKEDEQKGKMIFTVTRKGDEKVTTSVDFYTHEITAENGKDYVDTSGTVTFTPGQTQQFITVTIKNDKVYEGPRLFTVDLKNAVNAKIKDNQGLGTITDESDIVHH